MGYRFVACLVISRSVSGELRLVIAANSIHIIMDTVLLSY